MTTKHLMNPNTGSVDTEENWRAEMAGWDNEEESVEEQFDALIEVVLADGGDVPNDFNPFDSDKFNWVEA